ncbi:DUF2837 family protein [uncultured Hoeflea sp.]|uniref:lipid II flippase family protein n=1 Tax=uncultured Hoeflea sp. TaxID=538666 RepID=UPI0030ED7230
MSEAFCGPLYGLSTCLQLSAIFAGALDPEFRVTSSSLSAVINGVATIIMFILIAPYLAGLTDGVVTGKVNQGFTLGCWSGWC